MTGGDGTGGDGTGGDGKKDQCMIDVDGHTVFVYMMPNCGAAGIRKMALPVQLEKWNEVKADMEKKQIKL